MNFSPDLAHALCMALYTCDQDKNVPAQSLTTGSELVATPAPNKQNLQIRKCATTLEHYGHMMGSKALCFTLPRTSDIQSIELSVHRRVSQKGRVTGEIYGCKRRPDIYGLTGVFG